MNVIHFPSGETAGNRSPRERVSLCRTPELRDNRSIPPESRVCPSGTRATASVFPSGDQDTPPQLSAILRSAPPVAATRYTPDGPDTRSSADNTRRQKAISPPFGDQAG